MISPKEHKLIKFRYESDVKNGKHSRLHTKTSEMIVEHLEQYRGSRIIFKLNGYDSDYQHKYCQIYISKSNVNFHQDGIYIVGVIEDSKLNLDFIGIKILPKKSGDKSDEKIQKENAMFIMEIPDHGITVQHLLRNKVSNVSSQLKIKYVARKPNPSQKQIVVFVLREPVPYYPKEIQLVMNNGYTIETVNKSNFQQSYSQFEFVIPDLYFLGNAIFPCQLRCLSFNQTVKFTVSLCGFNSLIVNIPPVIKPTIMTNNRAIEFNVSDFEQSKLSRILPNENKLVRFRYESDIKRNIHSPLHTNSSNMFIKFPNNFNGYKISLELCYFDSNKPHEALRLYKCKANTNFTIGDNKLEGTINTTTGNLVLDFIAIEIIPKKKSEIEISNRQHENCRLVMEIINDGKLIATDSKHIRHKGENVNENFQIENVARRLEDTTWNILILRLFKPVPFYLGEVYLINNGEKFTCIINNIYEEMNNSEFEFKIPQRTCVSNCTLQCPNFKQELPFQYEISDIYRRKNKSEDNLISHSRDEVEMPLTNLPKESDEKYSPIIESMFFEHSFKRRHDDINENYMSQISVRLEEPSIKKPFLEEQMSEYMTPKAETLLDVTLENHEFESLPGLDENLIQPLLSENIPDGLFSGAFSDSFSDCFSDGFSDENSNQLLTSKGFLHEMLSEKEQDFLMSKHVLDFPENLEFDNEISEQLCSP